ncbi:glycerate kinase [Listeria costaricensis]|uniref:glycerate kinase family protein n=1 Tax=Listeria costaricensis TaxID=2026604 RepID=UPI000C08C4F8|nr:glycerate kinase [Listeria costaricensis]
MKFVLAPDSFKGSLTAKEVCQAMEVGLKRIFPESDYLHVPMADGGEGTVQALVDATSGRFIKKTVTGPLGTPVEAQFGLLGDEKTAVIEMAEASGLHYVNAQTKNPLKTTTYGTGELIAAALDYPIDQLIIGLGGSATNDGGAGMAQALGVQLLDWHDDPIGFGGEALADLVSIELGKRHPRLNEVTILLASDVKNPLCGSQGASQIFGPQKGATPKMVEQLDQNLRHYAEVIQQETGKQVADLAGAGAAGGLGAGLLAFTDASIHSGVELVMQMTSLDKALQKADFCFTGEGGIDAQTKFGKTPIGVAHAAQKQHVPVIAIAGRIGDGTDTLYPEGIDAIFGIVQGAVPLEQALADSQTNIARTCENIARLLNLPQH